MLHSEAIKYLTQQIQHEDQRRKRAWEFRAWRTAADHAERADALRVARDALHAMMVDAHHEPGARSHEVGCDDTRDAPGDGRRALSVCSETFVISKGYGVLRCWEPHPHPELQHLDKPLGLWWFPLSGGER